MRIETKRHTTYADRDFNMRSSGARCWVRFGSPDWRGRRDPVEEDLASNETELGEGAGLGGDPLGEVSGGVGAKGGSVNTKRGNVLFQLTERERCL